VDSDRCHARYQCHYLRPQRVGVVNVYYVIAGAIVASLGSLLTLSPNGLSLLGVLAMVYGIYRLSVSEAHDAQ
jgi:hypothetical protein